MITFSQEGIKAAIAGLFAFTVFRPNLSNMCGRFTLRTSPQSVASLFTHLQKSLAFKPVDKINASFNIAPTQPILSARQTVAQQLEFVHLRWGLVPFWANDLKIGSRMLNARAESVAVKPSFRSAFKNRRCLIVADGFYEWQKKEDGSKQPHYITLADERPFCFAGLWESWGKEEERVESCTIITTEANQIMRPLHHRMPVILDQDQYELWLDPEFHDGAALQNELKSFESDRMTTTPISTFVNKVANNSAECIIPMG